MNPLDLSALADRMGSPDPATAKAAKLAMERAVHQSLAPLPGHDAPDGKAQVHVADMLLTIARSNRPRLVRAHALYLLGFAGEGYHARGLGALENDPELGEDARMARTRIRAARA